MKISGWIMWYITLIVGIVCVLVGEIDTNHTLSQMN